MKRMAAILLFVTVAHAVEPDEILKDPQLESRARALSSELRCLVCQNQSIDQSDAHLAKDLRMLIREQLQDGKSDAAIMDFVVSRYGEYVLLKPVFRGATLLLWLAPFLLLATGALVIWRRKPQKTAISDLSLDEQKRLNELLSHHKNP